METQTSAAACDCSDEPLNYTPMRCQVDPSFFELPNDFSIKQLFRCLYILHDWSFFDKIKGGPNSKVAGQLCIFESGIPTWLREAPRDGSTVGVSRSERWRGGGEGGVSNPIHYPPCAAFSRVVSVRRDDVRLQGTSREAVFEAEKGVKVCCAGRFIYHLFD